MLPNFIKSELAHRKIKRQLEIDLVIKEIELIKRKHDLKNKNFEILEFGSGNGFQIPFLKKLGNLTSSDIYTSDEIKEMNEKKFICCDILNSPFPKNKFDLIFSNHVIEHIPDKTALFKELKRISSNDCILALSVPTNLWLLLTIPGQYFRRIRTLIYMIINLNNTRGDYLGKNAFSQTNTINKKLSLKKFYKYIIPLGHGVTENFFKCYNEFKIESWVSIFKQHGLNIIKIKPLLLYGPSEWPLINTKFSKSRATSSVLFLMQFDNLNSRESN